MTKSERPSTPRGKKGGVRKRARQAQKGAGRAADASTGHLVVCGLPGRVRDAWAQAANAVDDAAEAAEDCVYVHQLRRLTGGQVFDAWGRAVDPATPASEHLDDAADTPAGESPAEAPAGRRINFCSTTAGVFLEPLLDHFAELKAVVFYQPPWDGLLEACQRHGIHSGTEAAAWLEHWLTYHECVLAAREAAPDRILLVSASRSTAELRTLYAELHERGLALPKRDRAQDWPEQAGQAGDRRYASVLGRVMQDAGAEYWDLYESLESCALLLGREPEFRANEALLEEQDLAGVLALWCDAVQKPALTALAEERLTLYRQVQTQAAAAGAARDALEQQLQEARQEGELLQMQVHQVQEELERTFIAQRAAEDSVKRLEQENADLQGEVKAARAGIQEGAQKLQQQRDAAASATAQAKSLQAQLQQAQQDVAQARKQLAEAQKQAQGQSKAADEARAGLEQKLRDAQQETELLLLQLHQVQEELEHYYLENKDMQAVLGRSQDVAERARRLISSRLAQ
jgi:predicted  nucleic acid-binding Zn-ribbon protein